MSKLMSLSNYSAPHLIGQHPGLEKFAQYVDAVLNRVVCAPQDAGRALKSQSSDPRQKALAGRDREALAHVPLLVPDCNPGTRCTFNVEMSNGYIPSCKVVTFYNSACHRSFVSEVTAQGGGCCRKLFRLRG
jgi:hypothetical protein